MKKLLLPGIISLFLISACGDDWSNLPNVVIKGSISGSSKKSSLLKSAGELSLADAQKVLVFTSTGYKLFDIRNESFNAYALAGTATALAFLDANNQYIGCLSAGGLNVLPLVSLKDGDNTIIDLGGLTLEGTRVFPNNDPIGNEIDLSQEEIARYRELGSYYESLSKNIDANNDGEPDILSKKDFNISTIFHFDCGSWGLNQQPPVVNDTASFLVNYMIRIFGGKSLIPQNTAIAFSGPLASPYTDIFQEAYSPAPDGFISAFVRRPPTSPENESRYFNPPFSEGLYTVRLDNAEYTLNYSNINVKYFLILALPTVHTNAGNEIVSVSIAYQDMEGMPIIADNFVYQTQISLGGRTSNLSVMGALWENPEAKTNTELYNFVLPEPVPYSELQNISVMYVDLIGNSYNLRFEADGAAR